MRPPALRVRFTGKVALDSLLTPVWAAAFVLLFMDAASWAYARQLTGVTPGVVTEAFGAIGVAILGFSLLRRTVRPRIYPWSFLIAIAAYGLLCVNPFSGPNLEPGSVTFDRLGFAVSCISFIGLAATTRRTDTILLMLRWAVVAACLLNLVDRYFPDIVPIYLTDFPGRAAGFYRNPNTAAMTIAAALPLATWGVRERFRLAMYAVTLAGILATNSRGGLMVWAVGLLLSRVMLETRPQKLGRIVAIGAVAMITVLLIIAFREAIFDALAQVLPGHVDPAVIDRYVTLDDFAAQERQYGAFIAWQAFLNAPLFGNGVGYFVEEGVAQGPHNMVLLTISELGLLGGVWFAGFIASLFRFGSRIGVTTALVFLTSSMFSHNLFDDAIWAVLLSLYWRVTVGFAPAGAKDITRNDRLRPIGVGALGARQRHSPSA